MRGLEKNLLRCVCVCLRVSDVSYRRVEPLHTERELLLLRFRLAAMHPKSFLFPLPTFLSKRKEKEGGERAVQVVSLGARPARGRRRPAVCVCVWCKSGQIRQTHTHTCQLQGHDSERKVLDSV